MRSVPVWLMMLFCGCMVAPAPARSDPGSCQPAELFATDNTTVSTDQPPDDLGLFESQASVAIAQTGAMVTGSTLVDGVFWSSQLQQITHERSRQFHLCVTDGPMLHTAAEVLRRQFNQETALTFEYLRHDAPQADAILIAVPDVDFTRFRDALVADSTAQHRLLGGSVTTTEHTLLLVTAHDDLDIARRLIDEAGGSWNAATIDHGRREFVQT